MGQIALKSRFHLYMTQCTDEPYIQFQKPPNFEVVLEWWKLVLNTQCHQYLWLTMWFHAKNRKKHSKNQNRWFYNVNSAPELRNDQKLPKNGWLNSDLLNFWKKYTAAGSGDIDKYELWVLPLWFGTRWSIIRRKTYLLCRIIKTTGTFETLSLSIKTKNCQNMSWGQEWFMAIRRRTP